MFIKKYISHHFYLFIWLLATLIATGSAYAHQKSPLGLQELGWSNEVISHAYNLHYDNHGGTFLQTRGTIARVQFIEGKQCLVGTVLAFDVNNSFAYATDEDMTLTVLVDSQATDGLYVSYDRAGRGPSLLQTTVPPSGDRWHTIEFKLERAHFGDRGVNGLDMTIASQAANLLAPKEGKKDEITVCNITLERSKQDTGADTVSPTGSLQLTVRDADSGDVVPARVGLYDDKGRLPRPSDDALTVSRYGWDTKQLPMNAGQEVWPAENHMFFYVDGHYSAELPAGEYDLVVTRGIENSIVTQKVTITENTETSVEVDVKRWADMSSRGWYSADQHIHIGRLRQDNPHIAKIMQAEDLRLANLLQMSNIGIHYFDQYAFGKNGHFMDGDYALIPGQESPRTSTRGHSIGLNGSIYHDPNPDYFLFHKTIDAIHADGGLFGYAHVAHHAFLVERGLAFDLPAGIVDFVEVMQYGTLGVDLLYNYLNMGFKLIPVAGSDFPYVNLPGTERNYVKIDGEYSVPDYFAALKAGRTFVTCGPMLEFEVNGKPMGSEILVNKGERLNITASATINPDIDRLARLELVKHGEVIETINASSSEGTEELQLNTHINADEGMWIAVRAYGVNGKSAHTTPIYILPEGEARFWKKDTAKHLIEKQIETIDVLVNTPPVLALEVEAVDTLHLIEAAWREQQPELAQRGEEMKKIYRTMLNELD